MKNPTHILSQMGKMPPLSASQLKLWRSCPARWGFVYLDGEREPDTEATLLGKEIHSQLEQWVLRAKLPTHRVALAGLKHAPPPGTAHVERELAFETAPTPWRGLIDVHYATNPTREGYFTELAGGHLVIQDWKTTSSLANKLSEEALLEDVQANLYAYESFVHQRARTVEGKWVYLQTKGAPHAEVTSVLFSKKKVLDFVENVLDKEGAEIQKLYKLRPKWSDLDKNTSFCFSYGKPCPKYDVCPKPKVHFSMTPTTGAEMSPFQQHVSSQFPPIPGSVPSAPPSAPPPALPPIPRSAPPVPESGFVNPPEAPRVAARSPEHAAALQNVAPPAPKVAVADDLDALTRDQLKALAVECGCEPENTRKRESALRDAIRLHRANGGSIATDAVVPPSAPSLPVTAVTWKTMSGEEMFVSPAPTAAAHFTPPTAPAVPSPATSSSEGPAFGVSDGEAREAEMLAALGKALRADVPLIGHGWTLFIDCAPLDGSGVPFGGLVERANKMIEAAGGPNDYRLVDFGKGPAHLANAIVDLLETNTDDIVIESNTQEAMACLAKVVPMAGRVVRAFR